MTAKEVLRILQITRPTLTRYVKEGKLKVIVKGNGRYDYDADSVYKMLNKDIARETYLYARVSMIKQKTVMSIPTISANTNAAILMNSISRVQLLCTAI